MKNKIAKNIIAMIMCVSCIAGMAFGANAYTISFGANQSHGYSSSKVSITYVNRTSNISSASFNVSGMVSGAFPNGKYVCVRLYSSKNSNATQSTPAIHYALGTKSLEAYQTGSYYIGAYTNASEGATISVTV